MSGNVADWVADKLVTSEKLEVLDRTPEGFLIVRAKGRYTFVVAVLGIQGSIGKADVAPLFGGVSEPQFVANVPSKTLWSGSAIDLVHDASAAFGTFGDISRAAATEDAGSFRDKNMGFFINAMRQHSNVSSVSYVYQNVFKAHRRSGSSLVVAVINAYHMSAEDVRNAKSQFGSFDIVVKASNYGSITGQAEAAATSMGVEALTFRELMRRLGK
jgi:hypothetical protein